MKKKKSSNDLDWFDLKNYRGTERFGIAEWEREISLRFWKFSAFDPQTDFEGSEEQRRKAQQDAKKFFSLIKQHGLISNFQSENEDNRLVEKNEIESLHPRHAELAVLYPSYKEQTVGVKSLSISTSYDLILSDPSFALNLSQLAQIRGIDFFSPEY